MTRSTFSVVFLLVLLSVASVTPAQTVTGSLADAAVARGGTVKGHIVLSIPEGLHVNSNKPNSEYAIPTSVRITPEGFRVGPITYPDGTNRKFQFSEIELNVYEGEIIIPFTVTIPKAFRGKTLSVKAVVRYQACTDEVCYPPRNKEIVMTAAVK